MEGGGGGEDKEDADKEDADREDADREDADRERGERDGSAEVVVVYSHLASLSPLFPHFCNEVVQSLLLDDDDEEEERQEEERERRVEDKSSSVVRTARSCSTTETWSVICRSSSPSATCKCIMLLKNARTKVSLGAHSGLLSSGNRLATRGISAFSSTKSLNS